ncbi:MAG: LysM peptidoglycan-binding domain-containing protein [Betaproteobacteria bacterium]|nr:LysM peptidoglycan-binding domain-containing protein [Betaproteobacteria bacterium]
MTAVAAEPAAVTPTSPPILPPPAETQPAKTGAVTLAPNAPRQYTVQRGDTLWGIAEKFLQQPWRWPEIWHMNNAQIKNPHRIYPGDIINIQFDPQGNPQLNLVRKLEPRAHARPLQESIPSIPPNVLEPFTSEPLIVDADSLDDAPHIVATQEDRVFLGGGDRAYVVGAGRFPDQELWQIYRPAKPVRDPQTDEILGYEAYFLGTLRQIEPGDPAVFEVATAKEEINRGDRLLPAIQPRLISYAPHAPGVDVNSRIVSIYGGVTEAGRLSVVILNRGEADGLEVGHVLALWRNRAVTIHNQDSAPETVTLPPERYGLVFVFRVFDRLSYGLVVQSSGSVQMNDFARTP